MAALKRVKVFTSGNSQAVRLPKELAFPSSVHELLARREGNRLILESCEDDRFSDGFWKALGTLPGFRRPPQTRRRRRLF